MPENNVFHVQSLRQFAKAWIFVQASRENTNLGARSYAGFPRDPLTTPPIGSV